jgi:hypothetical protein
MMQSFRAEKALGYQQLTAGSIDASAGFASVPDGTVMIVFQAEAQAIRWRDDGTAPTVAIGQPLAVGQSYVYTARNGKQLRFISQVAGAILNATFYGQDS